MKKLLSKGYVGIVFAFLYIPILVMIAFSFNSTKSRTVFTGFTFDWYIELFQNELIIKSFVLSITLAILSSVIATILGTFAAIGFSRMKKKPRTVLMHISNMPVINPDIITGVSLMILFVSLSNYSSVFSFGFYTLLIAHITFNTPYVILSVLPKLRQLDSSQYEAALDLGCNEKIAFRKVVLPQIMPGIATGFLMSIAFSIDDFVISYFTSGPTAQTLPVTINSMIRRIVTPEIYALSTIMFFIVLFILLVYNYLDSKKTKLRRK